MALRCDCLKTINETLADRNARIGQIMAPSPDLDGRPYLGVEKIAPRGKKPPVVIASYCPFCGASYASGAAIPQQVHP